MDAPVSISITLFSNRLKQTGLRRRPLIGWLILNKMTFFKGYDYPDDPYILAGSCGLEYTIDRTGVNPSRDSKKSNSGNSGYSTNGWNNGKSYQGKYSRFWI